MPKMELFFDFACPYCLKGHQYLLELIDRYPAVEVDWRPCEAHPLPEVYNHHTDLCVQAFFFAQDAGANPWAVVQRLYDAVFEARVNYEDPAALAAALSGLVDEAALLTALQGGRYRQQNLDANDHAYEESGVWAVPAYRMNGQRLDSAEGVGITKQQLEDFLKKA